MKEKIMQMKLIIILKQIWNQFLLFVKATTRKQQILQFYLQIQRTDASDHIYAVSGLY